MTALQAAKAVDRPPQAWPLSLQAYHALEQMGLVAEKTELIYGQLGAIPGFAVELNRLFQVRGASADAVPGDGHTPLET
jgi:hypothetical protein